MTELLSRPQNMPKKELPPAIRGISGSDYKNRKRLIKLLVDQRLGYGKSVLFDTVKHQPRYPIDIIGRVLQKAEKKAIAIRRTLNFSKEETDLINQIFKLLVIAFATSLISHLVPLIERGQQDFIEQAFGLPDDAIEKAFGLPDHSVEKFIRHEITDASRNPIHGP